MLNYVHFQTWSWIEGKGICRQRGSISHQTLCKNPGCQERWEERRGRGKSPEKVQVTLFFFLETNSGWTQGDARQFTKSQALLSHFSKPCNLETGPQPTIASSSQTLTFVNLAQKKKKKSFSVCCWLIWLKCRWKRFKVKENSTAFMPDLRLFLPIMAVNAATADNVTRLAQ